MIPTIPRRRICLSPRVLYRQPSLSALLRIQATVVPLLNHRLPIESASIPTPHPQLLARISHTEVLALEFQVRRSPQLMLVELPRAVDGPVAQGSQSRETQRAWGERVLQEVPDQRNSLVNLGLVLITGECTRRRGEGGRLLPLGGEASGERF